MAEERMKAALFMKRQTIALQERTVPSPGPGEVLVRVMAAGVCGTDVHIYHGEPGSAEVTPPVVLGHEFSGIVAEIGSGAMGVSVGDHVTVDPNQYCGLCTPCRMGKKQLCTHMKAVGVTRDGGFADYAVVPYGQLLAVPKSLSFEAAALAEPVACCIHGIDLLGIRPGESVCVVGGGAIGLILLQLAKLSGAAWVALSEPNAVRREIALGLGADAVLNPLNPGEAEGYFRDRGGADRVVECAGNPRAMASAIEFAAPGATILMFSVPEPDALLSVPMFQVFQKELTIRGSFVNPDTHLRAVRLIGEGRIRLEPLITHRFPVAETQAALLAQMGADSVKVLVCEASLLG